MGPRNAATSPSEGRPLNAALGADAGPTSLAACGRQSHPAPRPPPNGSSVVTSSLSLPSSPSAAFGPRRARRARRARRRPGACGGYSPRARPPPPPHHPRECSSPHSWWPSRPRPPRPPRPPLPPSRRLCPRLPTQPHHRGPPASASCPSSERATPCTRGTTVAGQRPSGRRKPSGAVGRTRHPSTRYQCGPSGSSSLRAGGDTSPHAACGYAAHPRRSPPLSCGAPRSTAAHAPRPT
mmetsp:Transcript_18928/g.49694  ORF Transcript_18928/g.49694 Transcript_18928/m.49694 type:complete len:238 (+) Transcript_18928:192-905(+)